MIGFLHTAAAHPPTFDALLDALDAGVPRRHLVEASLLDDARAAGAVTPAVAARTAAAVAALAAQGARLVVCTCSTIGAAAEEGAGGTRVVRIDRPMAEAAVAHGPRVAVVAALSSTVAPTLALLAEVAAAAARPLTPRVYLCEDAWPYFERGDIAGYVERVAEAARLACVEADVVVLAQGSMASAADRLVALPVPVLASPRLGIAAAVRLWRALGA